MENNHQIRSENKWAHHKVNLRQRPLFTLAFNAPHPAN